MDQDKNEPILMDLYYLDEPDLDVIKSGDSCQAVCYCHGRLTGQEICKKFSEAWCPAQCCAKQSLCVER